MLPPFIPDITPVAPDESYAPKNHEERSAFVTANVLLLLSVNRSGVTSLAISNLEICKTAGVTPAVFLLD